MNRRNKIKKTSQLVSSTHKNNEGINFNKKNAKKMIAIATSQKSFFIFSAIFTSYPPESKDKHKKKFSYFFTFH